MMRAYYNQTSAGVEPTVYAHYVYSGGARTKKLVRTASNEYESVVYLGPFEYHKKVTASTTEEKNYTNVIGGIEIRTGSFTGDISDTVVYSLGDHLGSVSTRVNSGRTIIDTEEYYPYGDSAMRTTDKKRYRYTGKEKDAESGLYYYGARCYMAWTCTFTTVDPAAGATHYQSSYNYADCNPIVMNDPTGMSSEGGGSQRATPADTGPQQGDGGLDPSRAGSITLNKETGIISSSGPGQAMADNLSVTTITLPRIDGPSAFPSDNPTGSSVSQSLFLQQPPIHNSYNKHVRNNGNGTVSFDIVKPMPPGGRFTMPSDVLATFTMPKKSFDEFVSNPIVPEQSSIRAITREESAFYAERERIMRLQSHPHYGSLMLMQGVFYGLASYGEEAVVGWTLMRAWYYGGKTLNLANTTLKLYRPVNTGVSFTNKTVPTITEQAVTISQKIGKNSISIKTPNKVLHYDLKGATHKGVPTPHVQQSLPNANPKTGKIFWNKDRQWVKPMTQQDLRIIKNYLKNCNMQVKDIWTEEDFDEMGWHDSYIHGLAFPNEVLELSLDIDYLFKWILDEKSNKYSFWISPCIMVFADVLNVKVSLDYQNTIGLYIDVIYKSNPRLSINNKITLWDFEIVTDKGYIKFESSGYKQVVKKQPVLSQSQVLGRKKW